MNNIEKIVKILLKDKKLYEECGALFKYMGEVRINFSSLSEHNVPWQLSQILEIVYSNRLDGMHLNIFDVIVAYSTDYLKDDVSKKAAWANFDATFFISKIRKEKTPLTLEVVEKIIDIIFRNYGIVSSKKDFKAKIKNIDTYVFNVFRELLNGTFSNNPLYFFPLYLYIIEKLIINIPYKHVVRSVVINLYLMKNKLLFAPTISISYPLYYSLSEYIDLIDELDKDPKKISDFSRLIFDLLKQSSVVSRAFISNYSKINSLLTHMADDKKCKELKHIEPKNIMKLISLNDEILLEVIEDTKNSKKKVKDVLGLFNSKEMLKEIGQSDEYKVYLFNDYYQTIMKLNKNKSEKTTKIFILRENMN